MAFPVNITCTLPVMPTVGACVPFRLSKVKKLLAIRSDITVAEFNALLPVPLGGAGTSATITAALNALVTNGKLTASPIIGGMQIPEATITTITNTNACSPINIVTGQDITFNSTAGSTAATSSFVTTGGQGVINNWQEVEWWKKFGNCFYGGVFLVDCDSNLYYILNNNYHCSPALGASAFPTLSATTNLTIDELGVWTWKGKLSSSTGLTIMPAFNLGAITGAGAANPVLL